MGFFFIGELIYISLGAYFLRGGAIYEVFDSSFPFREVLSLFTQGTLAVREAPTAEVTIRPDVRPNSSLPCMVCLTLR